MRTVEEGGQSFMEENGRSSVTVLTYWGYPVLGQCPCQGSAWGWCSELTTCSPCSCRGEQEGRAVSEVSDTSFVVLK